MSFFKRNIIFEKNDENICYRQKRYYENPQEMLWKNPTNKNNE